MQLFFPTRCCRKSAGPGDVSFTSATTSSITGAAASAANAAIAIE